MPRGQSQEVGALEANSKPVKLLGGGPVQRGSGTRPAGGLRGLRKEKRCWFQRAHDVLDPDHTEVILQEKSRIEKAVKKAGNTTV